MCSTSLDTREVSYDEATVNNNNKVKQQFSALYVRQVSYALFLRQMKSLQLMKPVLIWWRRRAEAASGGHKYL